MISEREAVERERRAFREGVAAERAALVCCTVNVAARYPLPRRSTPREERFGVHCYRVVNGQLVRLHKGEWWVATNPVLKDRSDVVRLLNLYDHPTVDDEVGFTEDVKWTGDSIVEGQ